MAHYAQLGVDNIVVKVWTLDNINSMTAGGIEKDEIGQAYLKEHHGDLTLVKCSYNTHQGVHWKGGTPFRANYPGVGWYYSSTHDIFYEPRPIDKDGDSCTSWTLNTTTGMYEAPITQPTGSVGKYYVWDESAYQADNSTGWFLLPD
tara:strand:+ start:189 stop:629 length:441 start_codon:yes stop_codon:yes gene_type:complete